MKRIEQVIEVVVLAMAFLAVVLILWLAGRAAWAALDAPGEMPAETRAPEVTEPPESADDLERVYRHDFAFEHRGENVGASPELYRQLDEVQAYFGSWTCPEDEIMQPPTLVYLGEWYITGYDLCEDCCGKTDGVTASGTMATVGRTVSVGEGALEYGTKLWIPGIGERVVEDRGGLGMKEMDMLCASHAECYALTGWYRVYRVVEP